MFHVFIHCSGHQLLPLCVSMARCGLDRLFLQLGWPWSVNVLAEIIDWLQKSGIDDPIDLVGTVVANDIPGYERFPCDVLRFVERAAQAFVHLCASLC